jgi:hypothetical protein
LMFDDQDGAVVRAALRLAGFGNAAVPSNDRRSNKKAPAFFTGADDV